MNEYKPVPDALNNPLICEDEDIAASSLILEHGQFLVTPFLRSRYREGPDVSHSQQSRPRARWSLLCRFLIIVIAIATVGLMIWQFNNQPIPDPVIPTDSRVSTLFMPDDLFNPTNRTVESDLAWANIQHGRYLLVENPQTIGLPASHIQAETGKQIYALAAFHQLHCLALMRAAWHTVLDGGTEALNHPVHIANNPPGHIVTEHVEHCFDYLRQTIMCYSDTTLEPFLESDGRTLKSEGSSGWGAVHMCRNFDKFASWAKENDALRFES
ncbi:hypothetical protein F5884DRAFT_874354 [Xylogone sp. PMI_703]|nr:hypothetical protein F5884DRAFT_874354 [Xylogone sp. PMI_703]